MSPELAQLSDATQRAWRRIDQQFMNTGRYPATRAAARSIAEACDANVPDVMVLSGFKDRNASRPAKKIADFLHKGKLK
jgi:hypothetical protein